MCHPSEYPPFPTPADLAREDILDNDPVARSMVELLAAFDSALTQDAHYPTETETGTVGVLEFLQERRADVAWMLWRAWKIE